jgi:hypothetical protein
MNIADTLWYEKENNDVRLVSHIGLAFLTNIEYTGDC